MDEKEILRRKLAREQKARASAEEILESKSRELYFLNKELEQDRLSLFENASIGIAVSKNNEYLNANAKYCEMMAYLADELRGVPISGTCYPEDHDALLEAYSSVSKSENSSVTLSLRFLRKDKRIFWGRLHIVSVFRADGSLRYCLSLLENIQDVKNAQKKQDDLLTELKRSNTELEAFAQMVSHDLKSPLKGARTLFEWLRKDYEALYDDEAKSNLLAIEERLDKMTGLIDGIMSYTKLADEGVSDEVNLEQVVDSVTQLVFKPKMIEIRKKGQFPTLFVNRHKMHQLFQNLIDNAVKFCNTENGLVEIDGREDEEFYIFSVSDNGPGIAPKYHQKIFKIFNTLDNRPDNTGIGLSIVKNIVEQYGGSIFVVSEPGQGATFTFTLAKERFKLNKCEKKP